MLRGRASGARAGTGEGPVPHVVFLNWRDTTNPEGGGSERYVETIAEAFAARGARVTVVCARYPGSPPAETRRGVRLVRVGGKLTVYPRALLLLLLRRLGRVDAVVDVQNGVPFFSRLVVRDPVVLVHHVHREQWPVVYGRVAARFGWWLESRVAPRLYRGCRYVAVSEVTRGELAALGVDPAAVTVVHNGTEPPPVGGPRSAAPLVCVLGRLVPHKRVEHVFAAAAALRGQVPGLRVAVVGRGWWEDRLRAAAAAAGVAGLVDFHGWVDEAAKHRLLAASWVLAAPSLKEGWGLTVVEAGGHGVPAVAYAAAGGLAESIRDGATGLLVTGGQEEFTAALGRLLTDAGLREAMGAAARRMGEEYSWAASADAFAAVAGLALGAVVPEPRRAAGRAAPAAR